jgi:hypothetical protein
VGAFIDITGETFGRLNVIEFSGISLSNKQAMWLCQCKCGKFITTNGNDIRSGHTRSCGCLKRKHGHTVGRKVTPTWNTWHSMVQRCRNRKATQYKNYGGAGVRVETRWLKFSAFLADMGERPKGTTLGRKGDVGNYCKDNCRWESHSESERQRRAKRALKKAAKEEKS